MLLQELILDTPTSSNTFRILLVLGDLSDLVDHLLLADEAALGGRRGSLLAR